MRNVAIVFVCVLANAIAYLAYRNGADASTLPVADPVEVPVALPEVAPPPTTHTPAPVVPPPAPVDPVVAAPVDPVAPPTRPAPTRKTVKRPTAQSATKSESKTTSDDSLLKMEANPYKRGE